MLPAAGDIVWVELDPVRGTEQAGRRPALVLSEAIYHEESSRMVICPITGTKRVWPFNIPLPPGMKTGGDILVDQVRTVDRRMRLFRIIERVPDEVLTEVRSRLAALLGIEVSDPRSAFAKP